MPNVYLDSSAILKRYVEEKGTETINIVYSKADIAELMKFSLWDIGKVLGALDQYEYRGSPTEVSYLEAIKNFAGETMRLL